MDVLCITGDILLDMSLISDVLENGRGYCSAKIAQIHGIAIEGDSENYNYERNE